MPGGTRELSSSVDMPRKSILNGDEVLPALDTNGLPIAIKASILRTSNLSAVYSLWTELAATSGGFAGAKAEVFGDPGTHTDPVVGGTVPNSGTFGWSTAPAGWKWLTAASDAAVAAAVADAEAALADVASFVEGSKSYLYDDQAVYDAESFEIEEDIVGAKISGVDQYGRREIIRTTDPEETATGDMDRVEDSVGATLSAIDRFGRHRILREGDPEESQHPYETLFDGHNAIIVTYSEMGALIEPGQFFGGITYKDGTGRAHSVTEFGTDILLTQDAIIGEPAMAGPYAVKVALSEDSFSAVTLRVFGAEGGGSIYAGPVILGVHVVGQSVGAGSHASNAYFQAEHPWAGAVLMPDRMDYDGIEQDDLRVGVHANDTIVPNLIEKDITGLTQAVEKLSPTGYGGQTVVASYSDKMNECFEEVGRPQVTLAAITAIGGASWSEQDTTTAYWTNMVNVLKGCNNVVRRYGGRLIYPDVFHIHGQSDNLDYSPAAQAAQSGYFASLLEWQAALDAKTKEITGQTKDVPFLMWQHGQRHAGVRVNSAAAMLDFMLAHPDRGIVIGPEYPVHAAGYSFDNVHLLSEGQVIMGEYFARAREHLWFRRDPTWRPLHINSISWAGGTEIIAQVVNHHGSALAIDTTAINARSGLGFCALVDGAKIAATGVTVDSNTQLRIELESVPPAGTYRGLCYALEGPADILDADALTNLPAGNLRNTRTEKSRIPGFILHDWLCPTYLPL